MLTLAIIKPDAVAAHKAGKILAHLEGEGFRLRGARLVKLSQERAEAFYAESKERNAIHASDSPDNAAREVAFFFPERDLV
jgi:nucleoside diphosphate kinase